MDGVGKKRLNQRHPPSGGESVRIGTFQDNITLPLETPPSILAYESKAIGHLPESEPLILSPPNAAFGIAMYSFLLLLMGAFELGAAIDGIRSLSSSYQHHKLIVAAIELLLLSAVVWIVMILARKLIRRIKFGNTPCTIRRVGEELHIHFPARWGDQPRRFDRTKLTEFAIRRSGWAVNLSPLYHVDFDGTGEVRIRPLLFVLRDSAEKAFIEKRLGELLS